MAEKEDLQRVPFKVRTFGGAIARILSGNQKDLTLRVITFENGLKIALHPFDLILTDVGYIQAKDVNAYRHSIACKSPFAHTVQKDSNIPREMSHKKKYARSLYDFHKNATKENQTELAYFVGMVMSSFAVWDSEMQFACKNEEEFNSTYEMAKTLGRSIFGSTPSIISKSVGVHRFRFFSIDLVTKIHKLIGRNLKKNKIVEEVNPDGTIKKTVIKKYVLRKIPAFVKEGTREEKMAFVEGFLRNYFHSFVDGKIRDDLVYLLLGLGYNVRFKKNRCYLLSKAANAEDVHFLNREIYDSERVGLPAFEKIFVESQLYGNFTSNVILEENGIQSPKGLLHLKIDKIETKMCKDIFVFETEMAETESFMNYGCAIRPFGA